jgi:hypothetical protein
MAVQRYTLSQWLKLVRKCSPVGDRFAEISGPLIPTVCDELGITKQAVHNAIERDRLDAIAITTNDGSKIAYYMVTDASLAKFRVNRNVQDAQLARFA